jgi:hypothetical protein
MFVVLQIVSALLVSVAMALAVAHALDVSGKLRFDREHFDAPQSTYQPRFTVAGLVGEVGGAGATLLLILATPTESASLGWTVAALLSLAAMHATYWLLAHPANQFWLVRHHGPSIAPVGFFATHPLPRPPAVVTNWPRSRARWEYSHIIRAVLGGISLIALVTGLALD